MTGQRPDGEVTIDVGGKSIGGWTDVSISGGIDTAPAVFSLGMTEKPGGPVVSPGDACSVKIGGDLVIVGWVNRVARRVSAKGHTITVSGRSRVQDMVDCSAMLKQLSINNTSIGSLAREMAKPFAGPINVLTPDGDGDGQDYTIGVSLGETPWELVTEIATYEGLLVHDDARGDLILCRVGTAKMASGFSEGENCQDISMTDADDFTFSTYIPAMMAQDAMAAVGPGGNYAGDPVPDPLVKRYRPMIVISDQPTQGDTLAHRRAVAEKNRRRGRARQVEIIADAWRDSAGTLWTHNVLAPVEAPSVGLAKVMWIIASWTFVRNATDGTVAKLALMAPEAFSLLPTALNNQTRSIRDAERERENAEVALGTKSAAPSGEKSDLTAPNAGAKGGPPTAGEGFGL